MSPPLWPGICVLLFFVLLIEFVGATYLEIVSLGGSFAAAHFFFHFFHGCLLGVIGDA